MLTGLVKGLLLCCESENSTWNYIRNVDENVAGDSISSVWFLYKVTIPIILAVGILGNILIPTVLSRAAFRGIAYLYLSGIALAHLGVLISWIPIHLRLAYEIQNDYPSVFYFAHLELVALNTFSTASILVLTCLILDRYIFVFFPARIRTGNARKSAKSFILYAFILGFSTSAPLTGMRMVYEQRNDIGTTFALRENTSLTQTTLWLAYIWTMEVVVRACPTIILVVLNSLVVRRFLQLKAKKKQFQSVSQKFRTANVTDVSLLTRNRGYREEQHLTILTTSMISSFIITMIPSLLLSIFYYDYKSVDSYYPLFRALCIIIELCNFAVHIVTYTSCSEEFRNEFCKILQGKGNDNADQDTEVPVGEIEDFSRHGTTIRLTPEPTKLNSPSSPRKLDTMDEDKESELCVIDAV